MMANLMDIDLSPSLHLHVRKIRLSALKSAVSRLASLFHDGVQVSSHPFGINSKTSLNSIGDTAQP
jgi:hypothetical protein